MISPIISEGVNEATPKQRTPEEPKQRTAEEDYKLVMALAAEWLSKQKSSTEDADLTLEAFIKKFTDNNPHAPVPEKVREFYKLKDGATSIKDIPIDVLPASPMKNIVSLICGIIAIVPPLVIGLNMNCDVDQSEYTLENKTTLWGVFIPGIIWIIVSARDGRQRRHRRKKQGHENRHGVQEQFDKYGHRRRAVVHGGDSDAAG